MTRSLQSSAVIILLLLSTVTISRCARSGPSTNNYPTATPNLNTSATLAKRMAQCNRDSIEGHLIALEKAQQAKDWASMFGGGQKLASELDLCISQSSGKQKELAVRDQAQALYNASQGALGLAAQAGYGTAQSKSYLDRGLKLINTAIAIENYEINSGASNKKTEETKLAKMEKVRSDILKAER